MDSILLQAQTLTMDLNTVGQWAVIIGGLFSIWGMLTKAINKRIEEKANKETVDNEFKTVKKDILRIETSQSESSRKQDEILKGVNDIWQFLAKNNQANKTGRGS